MTCRDFAKWTETKRSTRDGSSTLIPASTTASRIESETRSVCSFAYRIDTSLVNPLGNLPAVVAANLSSLAQPFSIDKVDDVFKQNCPLWTYILAEAKREPQLEVQIPVQEKNFDNDSATGRSWQAHRSGSIPGLTVWG
jgi:hypothetical protein